MEKFLTLLFVISALFLIKPDVWADTIRMRNGQIIQGKYLGGTENTVRFQTDNKTVVYQIKEISAITFSSVSSRLSQGTHSTEGVQTPQPEQTLVTIVPGTRISIRMIQTVDTIISKKGDKFYANLESALVVDGKVVIPKGTMVRGQIIQSEQGKYGSALVITLQGFILKQRIIPMTTTNYAVWDKSQGSSETRAFNTPTRSRILRIPSQTFLAFKTTEPVEIDVAQ